VTRARISTDRGREFEVVRVLDDGSFVLRDDSGDFRIFDEGSILERVEVRCDLCGKWGSDVAPAAGFDDLWVCHAGHGPAP
jgi:hypothetical protein